VAIATLTFQLGPQLSAGGVSTLTIVAGGDRWPLGDRQKWPRLMLMSNMIAASAPHT